MFNAHTHDKRLLEQTHKELEAVQAAKLRERSVVLRSMLAAKYSRRVDQFILTMINDPIQVRQHVGPLPVVGRDTDPGKYKGPTSMVMKGYRTEQERVRDAVAASKYLSLEPKKPHEFRTRDTSKEINPNMYFTSKPKAVKETLQLQKSFVMPRDSFFLPNRSRPGSGKTKITHSKTTSVIDLERKTHFKGVMSKLMNRSGNFALKEVTEMEENMQVYQRTKTAAILWKHGRVLNRTSLQKYEGATMAKEVLESCQVLPKRVGSPFLRVGEGKLISNPFLPNREVYSQLYHTNSVTSSSFTI